MPQEGIAGYYLKQMLERLKERNYSQAVTILKELKQFLPGWAVVIQICLKGIQLELDCQSNVANETINEMMFLCEKLKKKAAEYIAAGQQEAARMILMQLKTILPEDKEIDNMLSQL